MSNIPEITLEVAPFGTEYTTLQAALDQAGQNRKNGIATKILVAPGIYRESVVFDGSLYDFAEDLPPITIEGPDTEAYVSGALPVYGWEKTGAEYTAPLTDEMIHFLTHAGDIYLPNGVCENPWPGDCQASDSVFANGLLISCVNMYYRVLHEEEYKPGTFRLDFENKIITVIPKYSWDEFVETDAELACRAAPMILRNTRNIEIYRLRFVRSGWGGWSAAAPIPAGLYIENCEDILIDWCLCVENRGQGFQMHKVRRLEAFWLLAYDNGNMGIGGDCGGYLEDLTLDVYVANNNWVGEKFGWTFYDPCGAKFLNLRRSKISDSSFSKNFGTGLWLDTGCEDIEIIDTRFEGNKWDGVQLEANPGRITFRDCRFTGNNGAIGIICTPHVTLEDCKIFGNKHAVQLNDDEGAGRFGYHTEHLTVTGCEIAAAEKPIYELSYWQPGSIGGNGAYFRRFAESFRGERNAYSHPEPERAFLLSAQDEPYFGTLQAWREQASREKSIIIIKKKHEN
ncbi:MAG: right-handed parallel beta-helix repeat-containing protein [Oscillospiraceae bacterium]|nr:right-handed parallel beta-helix repeat-containing protein [Oscillospiraceae bacterium]